MGWGRSLWGADSPYGMGAVFMGWGPSLRDGALVTGWDRSLWGAHSLYGTGALIMGWRRSRWAAGRLYGSGAALQAPRRRSMAAPRSPRSPRPPSPPLRSPPSPPVLLGPRWPRMAADGGGWRPLPFTHHGGGLRVPPEETGKGGGSDVSGSSCTTESGLLWGRRPCRKFRQRR